MSSNLKQSEASFVLKSRVALTNVETQPEIAAEMAQITYDAPKIAEGKALVVRAEVAMSTQKNEKSEESAASLAFKKIRDEVNGKFLNHRKKALFAFMDEPEVVKKLQIGDSPSAAYADWRDELEAFYSGLFREDAYMQAVTKVRVTEEEITATATLLPQLDAAYSDYYRETGESQEATRVKNEALRELKMWMRRFWKAARIALEDKPQLMEALMKGVRS